MAQAWKKLGKLGSEAGFVAKKGTKAMGSARDKVLKSLDAMVSYIGVEKKEDGGRAPRWYSESSDGKSYGCRVQYGTTAIKLDGDDTVFVIPKDEAKLREFYAAIREAIDAGDFDGELNRVQKQISDLRRSNSTTTSA